MDVVLKHQKTGVLGVNTYFVINPKTNKAVVIDCGENYDAVRDFERENGFRITTVLLTHAHFDHSGCAKRLQDDGIKIGISLFDAPKLQNDDNLSLDFGKKFNYLKPDYTFIDGDTLNLENMRFKVVATPGHTDGSVCFLLGKMLFSGDTLFHGSIGRTDFKSGNFSDMKKSLKRLYDLDGDFDVYPGHEEFTTLDDERRDNPYMRYWKLK